MGIDSQDRRVLNSKNRGKIFIPYLNSDSDSTFFQLCRCCIRIFVKPFPDLHVHHAYTHNFHKRPGSVKSSRLFLFGVTVFHTKKEKIAALKYKSISFSEGGVWNTRHHVIVYIIKR